MELSNIAEAVLHSLRKQGEDNRDITISEEQFREQVDPSLSHLDSLKGAFDRSPCKIVYYPPCVRGEKNEGWSVRGIVLISVGKVRGGALLYLYESIARLIEFELPDYEVHYERSIFEQES